MLLDMMISYVNPLDCLYYMLKLHKDGKFNNKDFITYFLNNLLNNVLFKSSANMQQLFIGSILSKFGIDIKIIAIILLFL